MLASYNASSYAVIKAGGIPAYSETQGYVKSIRSLEKSFARPIGRVAPSQQAAGAIYFAQDKLGTPYLWGGEGGKEDNGRFDCSGLTQAAYASVGITLPRVANDQWNAGPHPKRDELLPGDLVFFAHDLNDPRSIHHVGLYVGGGYMINAPYTGGGDPVRQDRHAGLHRGDPGDRRWRESAPQAERSLNRGPRAGGHGSPFDNVLVIIEWRVERPVGAGRSIGSGESSARHWTRAHGPRGVGSWT
ncbi:hypothetical protein GCM10020000_35620 [Streptomyces olivoverticillatus]